MVDRKLHRVTVVWRGVGAGEARLRLLNLVNLSKLTPATGMTSALDVDFELPDAVPGQGGFHLEAGVVVALITSGAALAGSVLAFFASLLKERGQRQAAIMEVTFEDGLSVKIPAGATHADIEKLLDTSRAVRQIKMIELLVE